MMTMMRMRMMSDDDGEDEDEDEDDAGEEPRAVENYSPCSLFVGQYRRRAQAVGRIGQT
jgi:hypothetical protein